MESSSVNEIHLTKLDNPKILQYPNYYEEILRGQTKSYCCTFPGCSKAFKYKSEILRHNVIHSNERPHHCTFEGCNKTFKRKDGLASHVVIHFREAKQGGFSDCDPKNSQIDLNSQTLKQRNFKNKTCKIPPVCEESFLSKIHLEQHEKTSVSETEINNLKKEEFEEPTKLVKREIADCNNSETGSKIKLEFCESQTPIKLETNIFSQGFPGNDLINMLQKENAILKRVLGQYCNMLKEKITPP